MTPTRPVVLVFDTVAVMVVLLTTVNPPALPPLKLTLVAPVKVVPVMVTSVPTGPEVGVKLMTAGLTRKLAADEPEPPGVVTLRGPVVAVAGTVAVMLVLLTTLKAAVT